MLEDNYIVRAKTLKQVMTSTRKIMGNRIKFSNNKVYKLYSKVSVYTGLVIVCTDSGSYELTYEVTQ